MEHEPHIPALAYFDSILRAANELLKASRSYRQIQEQSIANPADAWAEQQAALKKKWLVSAENAMEKLLSTPPRS